MDHWVEASKKHPKSIQKSESESGFLTETMDFSTKTGLGNCPNPEKLFERRRFLSLQGAQCNVSVGQHVGKQTTYNKAKQILEK